jgi:hypothetical protein
MANNVYKLSAISANGSLIKGVTGQSLDPNMEKFVNRGGGSPYPSYIAGKQKKPVLSFTTTDMKTLLDLTGLAPIAVGTTVDLYLAAMVNGLGIDTNATHLKLTLNHGMIIPRRIAAQQGAEATAQVDVISVYDGTNDPIVYAAAQSLPSGYDNVTEKFTLGPCKLAAMVETIGWDLDLGIRDEALFRDGEPYARLAYMSEMEPVATVRTHDATIRSTIGENGTGAVDPTLFLRKLVEGQNSRVADATAEHISILFNESMIYLGQLSGVPAEQTFMICGSFDGTNAIMTLDTTAAIA